MHDAYFYLPARLDAIDSRARISIQCKSADNTCMLMCGSQHRDSIGIVLNTVDGPQR